MSGGAAAGVAAGAASTARCLALLVFAWPVAGGGGGDVAVCFVTFGPELLAIINSRLLLFNNNKLYLLILWQLFNSPEWQQVLLKGDVVWRALLFALSSLSSS